VSRENALTEEGKLPAKVVPVSWVKYSPRAVGDWLSAKPMAHGDDPVSGSDLVFLTKFS
jgi:hypothetical protein